MINTNNTIKASVDEIFHLEEDIFMLRLILDYGAPYYAPLFTRYVRVRAELLEQKYLAWLHNRHYAENSIFSEYVNPDSSRCLGKVAQGGYYALNKNDVNNTAFIYDRNSDIFNNRIEPSPYVYLANVNNERARSFEDVRTLDVNASKDITDSNVFLYGFNVGQGDMLLLITSEKNAYLIDTNIYYNRYKNCERLIDAIKMILHSHNMDVCRIKGLVITHKHIDHLRGASIMIDDGVFHFENLLMNFDYDHPTNAVYNFLESAERIPTHININIPCILKEGNTEISFVNPNSETRAAPDINDSSVVMVVKYGDTRIYLTGDACFSVLKDALNNTSVLSHKHSSAYYTKTGSNVLKVSHHGSRTGTDESLAGMFSADLAFISAGNSEKYKHPHIECMDALVNNGVKIFSTKTNRGIAEYRCDGNVVEQVKFPLAHFL